MLDIAKVITLTPADKQRISQYYSTGDSRAITNASVVGDGAAAGARRVDLRLVDDRLRRRG
jgi:hypothetical protein